MGEGIRHTRIRAAIDADQGTDEINGDSQSDGAPHDEKENHVPENLAPEMTMQHARALMLIGQFNAMSKAGVKASATYNAYNGYLADTLLYMPAMSFVLQRLEFPLDGSDQTEYGDGEELSFDEFHDVPEGVVPVPDYRLFAQSDGATPHEDTLSKQCIPVEVEIEIRIKRIEPGHMDAAKPWPEKEIYPWADPASPRSNANCDGDFEFEG